MKPRKDLCAAWQLYVITGSKPAHNRTIEDVISQAILGGASVIQLREKSLSDDEYIALGRKILPLTRKAAIPLIINDRAHVAKAVGAQGVHLGQEDGPLSQARALLGPEAIIGRSTHEPAQAKRAEEEGFDYIGVGPVYATPTKPGRPAVGLDYVRYAASTCQIPFVAIGGIDESNIDPVLKAGARCVAVVRAVVSADDPRQAAERLTTIIRGYR